jgi:hypothetical protein
MKVVPKKAGVPTTEDAPLMYFSVLKGAGGDGVAFPARYESSGRVQWSGNPDVIDSVKETLVKTGILRAKSPHEDN